MDVLRTTLWSSPVQQLTTVVRAQDLKKGESFSTLLAARPSDAFVTHDAFNMPEGDIETATMWAVQRYMKDDHASREQNMALSFFWNGDMLRQVTEGGVLTNHHPAPLSADEIREVLVQLHGHPNYRKQTVVCVAEDWTLVTLSPDGTIKKEKKL